MADVLTTLCLKSFRFEMRDNDIPFSPNSKGLCKCNVKRSKMLLPKIIIFRLPVAYSLLLPYHIIHLYLQHFDLNVCVNVSWLLFIVKVFYFYVLLPFLCVAPPSPFFFLCHFIMANALPFINKFCYIFCTQQPIICHENWLKAGFKSMNWRRKPKINWFDIIFGLIQIDLFSNFTIFFFFSSSQRLLSGKSIKWVFNMLISLYPKTKCNQLTSTGYLIDRIF